MFIIKLNMDPSSKKIKIYIDGKDSVFVLPLQGSNKLGFVSRIKFSNLKPNCVYDFIIDGIKIYSFIGNVEINFADMLQEVRMYEITAKKTLENGAICKAIPLNLAILSTMNHCPTHNFSEEILNQNSMCWNKLDMSSVESFRLLCRCNHKIDSECVAITIYH